MNTSATGGVLDATLPDSVALRRFFQGLIAGISGLPGNMVRPRWQRNPPPMPEPTVDWCAFAIGEQTPDANGHLAPGDASARLTRHESMEVFCSFYGPNAEGRAELLRDGFEISQNREPLLLASIGFVNSTGKKHVPELANQQWYDRYDFSLFFNRETGKVYQILPFTGAIGAIITETLTLPFEVEQL